MPLLTCHYFGLGEYWKIRNYISTSILDLELGLKLLEQQTSGQLHYIPSCVT